jgi:3-hydroxyanthranilate 3,4-dioxygenase
MVISPFNFKQWIDEHRHLLKPPVMNQVVYSNTGNFIVMVVGGPNRRKDFHYNETEEFFYQLEGDITIKTVQGGKIVDVIVREGEIFLLPARVPHSPRRPVDSIGLVMEVVRPVGVLDAFQWYCEQCEHQLYEVKLPVSDIVKDLPTVMNSFYENKERCTCSQCGTVMERP